MFGIIGYDRKTPRIDQIWLQIRMLNSLTIALQWSKKFQEESLQKLRVRFWPQASNTADVLFNFAGIPTKWIKDFTLNIPSDYQITQLEQALKNHHSRTSLWKATLFGNNNPLQNIFQIIQWIQTDTLLTPENKEYFTIFILGIS
jgi:hypothetical protein